jgi:hypothetical protein
MLRQVMASIFAVAASAGLAALDADGETYDLRRVKGIQAFQGSTEARKLLARNGFVVADPAFKQIFEPYIQSPQTEQSSEKYPRARSLPTFITTDSAWHTYHVLLEEGVKELEEIQTRTLLTFSRQLWEALTRPDLAAGDEDLALLASIGLALQDERHRESLGPEAKQIVERLQTGSEPVPVPIGFSLSPIQFRAQSFYARSPELSGYLAARQWYGSVAVELNRIGRFGAAAEITGARLEWPEKTACPSAFSIHLPCRPDEAAREQFNEHRVPEGVVRMAVGGAEDACAVVVVHPDDRLFLARFLAHR